MNTQELFEQIENHFENFKIEHAGKSKAAHGRARKALGEIKKLVTEYRKASVAEDKVK
jgi:archaellum component FlaC